MFLPNTAQWLYLLMYITDIFTMNKVLLVHVTWLELELAVGTQEIGS